MSLNHIIKGGTADVILNVAGLEIAGQEITPNGLEQSAGNLSLVTIDPDITTGNLGSGGATYIRTGDLVHIFWDITATLSGVSFFSINFIAPFLNNEQNYPIIGTTGHSTIGGVQFNTQTGNYNDITNRISFSFSSATNATGTGTVYASITYNIPDP